MTKDDIKKYTNEGLLKTKQDYEFLLSTYSIKRYYSLTLDRITAEYKMILDEIKARKLELN